MIDRNWINAHAEEEINGAKMYFGMANECDNKEMSDTFICMARQELEHAGDLYSMMTMV